MSDVRAEALERVPASGPRFPGESGTRLLHERACCFPVSAWEARAEGEPFRRPRGEKPSGLGDAAARDPGNPAPLLALQPCLRPGET